jgi:uncharacterized protein YbcI
MEDGAVSGKISGGAVRILHVYTGRGPTKAKTVINHDAVVIVLGDTLTRGERALVEHTAGASRFSTRATSFRW